MKHIAGVVALAAMGNRGHIGRVRLDHQPFHGDHLGNLHALAGIMVGQHTGERNHPVHFHQFFGHFHAAGVAMEHALHIGKLFHNGEGITMSFAVVDDDRKIQLLRHGQLGTEKLLLLFASLFVLDPVVVQTDLADGYHLFAGSKSANLLQVRQFHALQFFGVETYSGINEGVLFRQFYRHAAGGNIATGIDHKGHAPLLQAVQDFVSILIELTGVIVGMCIKQHRDFLLRKKAGRIAVRPCFIP